MGAQIIEYLDEDLQQHYVKMVESDKDRRLLELLRVLNYDKVVIYVRSDERSITLSHLLSEINFNTIAINRGMSEEERLSRYQQFKDFDRCILVETNLIRRGMAIEGT